MYRTYYPMLYNGSDFFLGKLKVKEMLRHEMYVHLIDLSLKIIK